MRGREPPHSLEINYCSGYGRNPPLIDFFVKKCVFYCDILPLIPSLKRSGLVRDIHQG